MTRFILLMSVGVLLAACATASATSPGAVARDAWGRPVIQAEN